MIVNDYKSTAQLLDACQQSQVIAIDTETNFTDLYHERFLVGISICTEAEETFYIPVGHHPVPDMTLFDKDEELNFKYGALSFFSWLHAAEKDPVCVFHNAKFDLTILEKSGYFIGGAVADTMLMSHLVDENPPHGLKELGKTKLGIEEAPEMKKRITAMGKEYGWEYVHPIAMSLYSEQDALLTMKLYKFLLPQLEEQELVGNAQQDIQFMDFLRRIEWTGVRLDRELTLQRSQESASRMVQIRHEIGFEPTKLRLLADKLYGTPPQGLGLIPTSRTPKGAIQVNEAVLTGINHPLAGLVLEYRGLLKAKSTWYDGFLEKADLAGRLHPNFKQHGTLTGRLSCENPNLQQIPREGNRVKDLFLADNGYELWEFDFSQIELRLAAVYGNEHKLLTEFLAGSDIHQSVADDLGITRYAAKTLNFAILYGAGVGKIAEQLGVSFGTSKDYLDNYRSTYTGLARVAEHAASVAAANGWVKYWTGRRRHFKWPSEYHKAFNSIIQGGAFEIVKRAGLNIQEHRVVNQVHDSYWLELPKPVLPKRIDQIQEAMSDWTKEVFDLHFVVDAKRLAA
jgi:DNA polymerase I